ncbi:putative phosphatidylglycerol/phosphatidylinositol transfer protein 2 [Dysidea avara]|uniref:putative phosphatidylglycerol/phosphatidylinositol transfer protein 2 n=1 Tax=Dysidea avara TaxID=196820 RepID=UPI0033301C61
MLIAVKYSNTVWLTVLFTVISANPLMKNPEIEAQCHHSSCGTSSDKIQNVTVSYAPDPPQANKNVTIHFMGTLTEPIDKGELNAQFFFATRLVKNETYDLCTLLPDVNHTCPVSPGPFGFTIVTHVPPSYKIPPGRYAGMVNATDANQNVLFCLTGYCIVYL